MKYLTDPASKEELADIEALADALAIPTLWARVLWFRGIRTARAYAEFSDESTQLSDPGSLPDVRAAVQIIRQTVGHGRRIRVYGDYDADGVTATAVLVRILDTLAAQVDWRIPNRFDEGYGLQPDAVFQAHKDGIDLMITVDCGSSSPEAARLADSLGLGLIITDHHRLASEMPVAAALVNPERMGVDRQILSGAGVALQVGRLLLGDDPPPACWALAALGTVADVVPLRGESRPLIRRGLTAIRAGAAAGVTALLQVAGRSPEHCTARDLAFSVAPRINAAGRMGSPDPAVSICLTEHAGVASEVARQLEDFNRKRRQVEQAVTQEALASLPRANDGRLLPFLLVAGDGWHEGVVGIAAARLAERYRRPAAVVALEGARGKGSARSGGQGDILAVLRMHQARFVKLGGHQGAAGFTVDRNELQGLAEALSAAWIDLYGRLPAPVPRVDALLGAEDLTPALGAFLESLEPYGHQFPEPRFLVEGQVREARVMGADGRHLRLSLDKSGAEHVWFGGGVGAPLLESRRVQALTSWEPNVWRGEKRWQARWQQVVWPPSPMLPLRSHPWHEGTPRALDDGSLAPDVLVLVDSPYHLRQLDVGAPLEKVFPRGPAARRADLMHSTHAGWCASVWWDWDESPLPMFDALWLLSPPPHRWALAAALSWLRPTGAVYWSGQSVTGGDRVLLKWQRLVPDREHLLRLWAQRRAGRQPFVPGRQILRDLDLEGPVARPGRRRDLSESLYFRTAVVEHAQARRDWSQGGPLIWRQEEIAHELAREGKRNP